MKKRGIFLLAVVTLAFGALLTRIYFLGQGDYAAAAKQNSLRTITVLEKRADIYDCNLRPMTGTKKKYVAVVVTGKQALEALKDVLSREELQEILPRLEKGFPVTVEVPVEQIDALGIQVFAASDRYREEQLAPHIIGYLNGEGKGVSGIEKAFDAYLSEHTTTLTVSYTADARGRILAGSESEVKDGTAADRSGVALTLDSRIQKITAKAMEGKIEQGAAVVLDIQTGKVRGMVSMPQFSSDDIAPSLTHPSAPLINRALTPYAVGSTFKLMTALAALEVGYPIDQTYLCTGSIQAGSNVFSCVKRREHGEMNLAGGLAVSCNCYFIHVGQEIGGEKILEVAKRFGFGQDVLLAKGIRMEGGDLPTPRNLSSPAATANFSFGQGELTASPLQIASMVAAIADGGVRREPLLVEGLCDSSGQLTGSRASSSPVRVMRPDHAALLKQDLILAVEEGTGSAAKPERGGAGGKTGTAQSGWYEGGQEVLHSWFAGFYPAENPRYAIVILNENGSSGSSDCAPIFKSIVDALAALS